MFRALLASCRLDKRLSISILLVSFVLSIILSFCQSALAYQTVKAQSINYTARLALEKHLAWKDREIELKSSYPDRNVPDGKIVIKPGIVKMNKIGGLALVPVYVFLDGKRYLAYSVSFNVRVYTNALVATRMVKNGDILGFNDVVSKRCDISALNMPPIRNMSELAGKRTNRYLREGMILTPNMFEERPLVYHKDMVVLRIIDQTGIIEMRAKAMEDGRLNERIRVRLDSKEIITATVVGNGIVEIRE